VTPRERVQIALAGGRPDRVPFAPEIDYDVIAIAAGREPWEFTHCSAVERAEMTAIFHLRYDSDLWLCWGGPSYKRQSEREIVRQGDTVYYLDKRTGRRYRIDRLGDLHTEDDTTVVLGDSGEPIAEREAAIWVAGGPYPRAVEVESDIEELYGPVPPPEHWLEDGHLSAVEYLLPRYGQTHFLSFSTNTIFADALDLFGGFQEGLIALHTKRDLFHKALEHIVEWKKSRIVAGARLGAPGIMPIEYCAGADTISPAAYREFVMPYEREIVAEAHQHGMKVYIWYLGDLMPLLEDIAATGVDAIYGEQGRKQYSADVVEMRRRLGERTCLVGFNDEDALIAGDFAALERDMARQIEGAGRDGAFIMGTTYVTEATPPEHLARYVEILQRLGKY